MGKYLISLAAAAAIAALGAPAAQAGTGGEQPPTGVVSASPATNTPHLPATSTATQQIRQLVQCGGTMYAVGTFSSIIKGSTTYARTRCLQLQRHEPVHGHVLGAQRDRQHGNKRGRLGRDQLDRVQRRQLRGRLRRRQLHQDQRHQRDRHRRDQHQHRQRGNRLRPRRKRGRGHHPRGRRPPAGRRHVRQDQRRQHPVHGQPEPDDRGERRLPEPVDQGQPGLQPAAEPRRHAGPGRGRCSPRWAAPRASRCSC